MILGIDTATAGTAVAVWAPDGPEVERRDDPPAGSRPAHAQRLLPLVEEVLAAAEITWDAITRIAVGVGPGGFTGLRLGIATARALAQARGCELVGVSSLAALASPVKHGDSPPVSPGGRVVAVIDARRGEVFAAAYPGFGPVAIAPAELAARIRPGWQAVGDGAVRFREELERAGAEIPADDSPLHRVSALQVCRLGATAEPADRDTLLPDYRREPDAKPRQQ
ncbi:MAG TPA: tRNA (adenosine(37)-N6)-threonylcarbamoyltransferase complex dimerization subunit type 1 TsaB [Solirubrobacteraceae bacterium]